MLTPATNLYARAVANMPIATAPGGQSCLLSLAWSGGSGTWITVYINGNPYTSSSSGYNLWPDDTNGNLGCENSQVGGITAGKTFNIIVRTWNNDLTAHVDSLPYTYVVPSTFQCVSGGTTSPTPLKPHGHK